MAHSRKIAAFAVALSVTATGGHALDTGTTGEGTATSADVYDETGIGTLTIGQDGANDLTATMEQVIEGDEGALSVEGVSAAVGNSFTFDSGAGQPDMDLTQAYDGAVSATFRGETALATGADLQSDITSLALFNTLSVTADAGAGDFAATQTATGSASATTSLSTLGSGSLGATTVTTGGLGNAISMAGDASPVRLTQTMKDGEISADTFASLGVSETEPGNIQTIGVANLSSQSDSGGQTSTITQVAENTGISTHLSVENVADGETLTAELSSVAIGNGMSAGIQRRGTNHSIWQEIGADTEADLAIEAYASLDAPVAANFQLQAVAIGNSAALDLSAFSNGGGSGGVGGTTVANTQRNGLQLRAQSSGKGGQKDNGSIQSVAVGNALVVNG